MVIGGGDSSTVPVRSKIKFMYLNHERETWEMWRTYTRGDPEERLLLSGVVGGVLSIT